MRDFYVCDAARQRDILMEALEKLAEAVVPGNAGPYFAVRQRGIARAAVAKVKKETGGA